MHSINVDINGRIHTGHVEPRRLLVEFLRTDAGLTGTHVGCDTSCCGACTVLLDGEPVKSCSVLAPQADGRKVRTVEGLARGAEMNPLQKAFSKHHALQCGYCTPGFLMAATALLEKSGEVDEAAVRKSLAGNTCRCTGYQNIITAVLAAATAQGKTR